MSSVEVLRKRNWQCEDCGEFHWGVERDATEKEIKRRIKELEKEGVEK